MLFCSRNPTKHTFIANLYSKPTELTVEVEVKRCSKEEHDQLILEIKTRLKRVKDGQTTSVSEI